MKFEWPEIRKSFLRSLVPVGLTYSAALIGIEYFSGFQIEMDGDNETRLIGLFLVPLFTLTHCVVPVFIYFKFVAAIHGMKERLNSAGSIPAMFASFLVFLVFSGFIYLHLGLWYGLPTIVLGFMTDWLTIPVAIIHVALAKKGTRTWVFLEYGSTSFALLFFVILFSVDEIFPIGILVALFQILLLTIVDWKGRGLWMKLAEGQQSGKTPS